MYVMSVSNFAIKTRHSAYAQNMRVFHVRPIANSGKSLPKAITLC
ncbi:hypothetical protein ESA_01436 [Cronobacter sakazakii ATCC BAA-894]|uniref:Uncharacterized protein n=1 Tax=Cronobacter sakazakii (strain ATCC BAA-894) TaxID=290339 RepID=A7MKF6_CROS8|nr:hypothetical protein ESA_01436 [Cronobacter sakazakii ATCC BAA-894]